MSPRRPVRWTNKKSPTVTASMAAEMRSMYFGKGMKQHDIAAHFGVNQGRVSEVINRQRFPEGPPGSDGPTLFEH